jgi:hypothetical protein
MVREKYTVLIPHTQVVLLEKDAILTFMHKLGSMVTLNEKDVVLIFMQE